MTRRIAMIGILLGLTACAAQSPDTGSSTASGSTTVASSAGSGSSVVTEDNANEQMPTTIESLEVPSVSQPKAMTGQLTLSDTIMFGNAPSTSKDFQSPPVLLEFFDYDCEYCRQFALEDRPWIDATYVATSRFNIERMFVLRTQRGVWMAQAALCGGDQQKFSPVDELLLTTPAITETQLLAAVAKLGIDKKSFTACLRKPRGLQATGKWEGADGTVIDRTPAFRMGADAIWVGILSRQEFEKKIEKALKDTYDL